uniref:Uncharacterized protein n=1 Tax=Gopherus evgoodei TaxID=1825980 RepID=A0A8C4WBG2_9SAUR
LEGWSNACCDWQGVFQCFVMPNIIEIRNGSGIGLAIKLQHAEQCNRLASRSDSSNVRTSPSRTGPFTFQMMDLLVSSMNSTQTWVRWPCEPVRPSTLVTWASLMGCTRLVSMAAAAGADKRGCRGVTLRRGDFP